MNSSTFDVDITFMMTQHMCSCVSDTHTQTNGSRAHLRASVLEVRRCAVCTQTGECSSQAQTVLALNTFDWSKLSSQAQTVLTLNTFDWSKLNKY